MKPAFLIEKTSKSKPLSRDEQFRLYADFAVLKALLAEHQLLDKKHLPVKGAIANLLKLCPDKKRVIDRALLSKDKLIHSALAQATGSASRYRIEDAHDEDSLISAALESLVYALWRYNPDFGAKYSAYAYLWARPYLSAEDDFAKNLISPKSVRGKKIGGRNLKRISSVWMPQDMRFADPLDLAENIDPCDVGTLDNALASLPDRDANWLLTLNGLNIDSNPLQAILDAGSVKLAIVRENRLAESIRGHLAESVA